MYAPGRVPQVYARIPWYYAIHQPGATQMGYMRKLFESRPFLQMVPDNEVLAQVYGQRVYGHHDHPVRAARGADSSFVIIYSPYGNPIHLMMNRLKAEKVKGYWFNPREGVSIPINVFRNNKDVEVFVPPSSGIRTDWVLVLDDATKNYPDPGHFDGL